MNNIEIG